MTTNRIAADTMDKVFGPADDAARASGTRLMREALRLLAHGEPITLGQLAAAAGLPTADLDRAPSGQDIEYDERGRIVGWGLTLNPTPHHFAVDGHQLYTWCAPDTLLFPAIIGRVAQIESPCPATGTPVRLTVDPVAGITGLDPTTAVVSIADPDHVNCGQVRATLCDPQHFFATANAARDWLAQHPGGTVLPVAAAYDQLRPISEHVLGASQTRTCC